MHQIVFVEDDADMGALMTTYLAKHDIEVSLITRGDVASELIVQQQPDLVLLDVMLPGKDGLTLCRELRAHYPGPIVLLTSLDSDMNHILALEMGANDYILKTTPPAVLLARLRLHLRQSHSMSGQEHLPTSNNQHPLHIGQLCVDPVNRQVTLHKEEIALSTADFDLLWTLCTHAGQIMNREALLQTLRGVTYDGLDRSIDVAISRLRRKLGDNPEEPTRIKTIRNRGYLLVTNAWE